MNTQRDRLERMVAAVQAGLSAKEAVSRAVDLLAAVDTYTAPADAVARLDALLAEVCGEGATHETHDVVAAVRDVKRERDGLAAKDRESQGRGGDLVMRATKDEVR